MKKVWWIITSLLSSFLSGVLLALLIGRRDKVYEGKARKMKELSPEPTRKEHEKKVKEVKKKLRDADKQRVKKLFEEEFKR